MALTHPSSRICNGCLVRKQLEKFGPLKAGKYGRRSKCRQCIAKQNREWMAANRERYRKYKTSYFSDPKVKRRQKDQTLRRKYGITIDDYERLLEHQKGLCALCLKPESTRDRRGVIRQLAVDHDHDTTRVRGLLCFRCNSAISKFEKVGPGMLARLRAYLWGDA